MAWKASPLRHSRLILSSSQCPSRIAWARSIAYYRPHHPLWKVRNCHPLHPSSYSHVSVKFSQSSMPSMLSFTRPRAAHSHPISRHSCSQPLLVQSRMSFSPYSHSPSKLLTASDHLYISMSHLSQRERAYSIQKMCHSVHSYFQTQPRHFWRNWAVSWLHYRFSVLFRLQSFSEF